jgi:hypothetical protein
MDVKVYKKEEVLQPQGSEYVYVPDVIDIIPSIVETEDVADIKNHLWNLEQLKRIADVEIVGNKLIINSDNVYYENGNLYATLTVDTLITCDILDDSSKELLEQECALATIWQKGLDPLDIEDGIRWSESILGEISVIQLMDDIANAVEKTSTAVTVVFDTVTDANGNSYLTYSLKELV